MTMTEKEEQRPQEQRQSICLSDGFFVIVWEESDSLSKHQSLFTQPNGIVYLEAVLNVVVR